MAHGDIETLDDGRTAQWIGNHLYVTRSKTGRKLQHPYKVPEVPDVQWQLSDQILKLTSALGVATRQGIMPNSWNRADLRLLEQRIREWEASSGAAQLRPALPVSGHGEVSV